MFEDKKVVVVMPAYNAAQTLCQTYEEVMAQNIVDLVIIVDDASSDETAAIAAKPHSSEQSRLWRQSENLLRFGAGTRCRHHCYGASRLSVHAKADTRNGLNDWQ